VTAYIRKDRDIYENVKAIHIETTSNSNEITNITNKSSHPDFTPNDEPQSDDE